MSTRQLNKKTEACHHTPIREYLADSTSSIFLDLVNVTTYNPKTVGSHVSLMSTKIKFGNSDECEDDDSPMLACWH